MCENKRTINSGVRGKESRKEKLTIFGGADRMWGNVEIESLEKHGPFNRADISGIPEGGALIEGRCVCASKNHSLSHGYKKTGAYVDVGGGSGCAFLCKTVSVIPTN